jgi:nucleoid DNA-binding protein
MTKLELASVIHKRLNGTIKYVDVLKAVTIIIEQLAKDLVDDLVVTVRRFGTLSPYVVQEHTYVDFTTKAVTKSPSKRSVKLHAHEAFKKLIAERRGMLKKVEDES